MTTNRVVESIQPLLERNEKKFVLILMFIAMISRVVLVFGTEDYKSTRDWECGQIARNVLIGKGYSAGPDWISRADTPTAHKPPLYPAFLISVYYHFPKEWTPVSPDNLAMNSHLAVQLIQCVIFAFVALFTYLLARETFGKTSAFVAMMVLIFNPSTSYVHLPIDRNVLDMLFAVSILYLALILKKYRTIRTALIWGAVSGFSLLNNPSFITPILLVALWLLSPLKDLTIRKISVSLLLPLFIVMAIVFPWIYRNYLLFKEIIPISSNAGLELWIGNHPGASGGLLDENLKASSEIPEDIRKAMEPLNERQRYQYLGKLATSYIKSNPMDFIRLRVYAFVHFWFADFHWSRPMDLRNLIFGYGGILTILIGWVGLWKSIWRKWRENIPYLLFIAGFSSVYVLTHGGPKYRDGLFPLISIYIGNLLVYAHARVEKRLRPVK